ncbi:putative phage capsid protein (plasmid) [Selenomonas ruminantium subsp. lactilytica TAM6421]|uniref:Putative phage capsid protein n=1 Tax=Selenomonas ruminantium subsp. lactilytica (strain NBRC 103574 / TAM6421) TaxID=927704 RepID=I0GWR0_SELRL|nr:phage major capsid protein [Selenomonas ruminantium]BAL85197.1 putative phage capsid protein [Selenomonas ruminantium subsp. lactilytica TAM6421]
MDRIHEIEVRMAAIVEASKEAEGEELKALADEADKLTAEKEELRKAAEEAEQRKAIAEKLNAGEIAGNHIDIAKENKKMDINSTEYRSAFKDYVETGVMNEEFRAVAMTAQNSAVIPPTVMNQIVEKMTKEGSVLSLVRRIAFPAGAAIPKSELAATANWIAEGAEIKADGKGTTQVTFAAFPLAAAIGVSFKLHVQSLSAFENSVVENVSRAMVRALESAIISGDGNGKPQGIVTASVPANRIVEIKQPKYTDLIAMLKAVPAAYKAGSVIVMNENTYLDFEGMVDNNGQPIARTNYGLNGAENFVLKGKKVVTTDFLPSLDEAGAGDVVAFVYNLDNYVLNTAYDMDLQVYQDNPTRNKVFQSYMLVDGKPVDTEGLVLVKKAASAKA